MLQRPKVTGTFIKGKRKKRKEERKEKKREGKKRKEKKKKKEENQNPHKLTTKFPSGREVLLWALFWVM